MDTTNLKVGDWIGVVGGWGDVYPFLILKIIDEETILADEVFCRYPYHKRIVELQFWVLMSDENQQGLYDDLSREPYYDEYKKFFRIRKLQKIDSEIEYNKVVE